MMAAICLYWRSQSPSPPHRAASAYPASKRIAAAMARRGRNQRAAASGGTAARGGENLFVAFRIQDLYLFVAIEPQAQRGGFFVNHILAADQNGFCQAF